MPADKRALSLDDLDLDDDLPDMAGGLGAPLSKRQRTASETPR